MAPDQQAPWEGPQAIGDTQPVGVVQPEPVGFGATQGSAGPADLPLGEGLGCRGGWQGLGWVCKG